MVTINEAIEKAAKSLVRAQHLEESDAKDSSVTIALSTAMEALLEDLGPLADLEVKKPAWLGRKHEVIDYEVLTVLVREMSESLWGNQPPQKNLAVEDSRFVEGFFMDAAGLFTRHHYSKDPDYWMSRIFLDEVMKFCEQLTDALMENPEWINTDYRMAYGKDTVEDLLKLYYRKKHPIQVMDMRKTVQACEKLKKVHTIVDDITKTHPEVASRLRDALA